MKTENPGVIISIKNNNGDTISKHSFVSPEGTLVNTGEDYNTAAGVCLQDTLDGDYMPVAVTGVVLCISGGAIGLHHRVSADGGNVSDISIADPPDTIELASIVGIALDAAAGANEIIRVLITH